MQFGLFLVHRRVITRNEFVTALETQLASRPQLGRLALEEERLSVQQVFQLLGAQCDLPEERFGDLAIECGMMTEADLTELLRVQSELTRPMSDILVELGYITSEEKREYMVEFRKSMEELGVASSATTA